MTEPRRYTPPALFLLLDEPYGAAVGYVTIAVPLWLARAGVPAATCATVIATSTVPPWAKILWAPLGAMALWTRRAGRAPAAAAD